jgi:hypothetical protein
MTRILLVRHGQNDGATRLMWPSGCLAELLRMEEAVGGIPATTDATSKSRIIGRANLGVTNGGYGTC